MKPLPPPLSDAAKSLKLGAIYVHYKGMRYRLLHVARHSETLEELVVYQALYGTQDIWVRPVSMFTEQVKGHPRFQLSDQ